MEKTVATAHITVEITGDDAMTVYKAAKLQGVSIRRFILEAATTRAQEVLSTPRLVVTNAVK